MASMELVGLILFPGSFRGVQDYHISISLIMSLVLVVVAGLQRRPSLDHRVRPISELRFWTSEGLAQAGS